MATVKPGSGRARAPGTDRHVGGRMRERRIMLGLTQHQMAALIGVTYQQAHKYEKGINRVAAGRLYHIAQALGSTSATSSRVWAATTRSRRRAAAAAARAGAQFHGHPDSQAPGCHLLTGACPRRARRRALKHACSSRLFSRALPLLHEPADACHPMT